ncbi:hypothetical protein V6N11_014104 [Hibiscus sabdariffa]|uniref:Uncharacterized protein n=2 Tax=Hibiscus sabdariffa TaxID=183260 RepID=A0ABR2AYJ2_9ROSI
MRAAFKLELPFWSFLALHLSSSIGSEEGSSFITPGERVTQTQIAFFALSLSLASYYDAPRWRQKTKSKLEPEAFLSFQSRLSDLSLTLELFHTRFLEVEPLSDLEVELLRNLDKLPDP